MASHSGHYAAVDLGAGSGRVLLGRVGGGAVECELVQRFAYAPRKVAGRMRWDFTALMSGVRAGLAAARERAGELRSAGVDGWGVDYGWLDEGGTLLADPVSYREARTQGMPERLLERVPRAELYARTGIQLLPIDTSVQMLAERELGELPAGARSFLMVPDLVHRALCGSGASEVTNASTTQLLSARTRAWDERMLAAVGLERSAAPQLVEPGTSLGVATEIATRIVAPATHDTASAVLGTPLAPEWAYLSSGTWSLFGLELAAPVLSGAACAANFTNEAGAFGTTRFLKNVMGLWILERCRDAWEREGRPLAHERIAAALGDRPPSERTLDPDDPRFLDPEHMPDAVRAQLRESGQADTDEPLELAHAILTSLALRCAEVLSELERLTGARVRGVHVVGGGSRNGVLNQMLADAAELPVLAGPVEATAIGNLLVQAIADGALSGIDSARSAVARAFPAQRCTPRASERWRAAARSFRSFASSR